MTSDNNLVPRVSHFPALPERERRDPGTGWSRVSWTIENTREGSSNVSKFVALSFVDSKGGYHTGCNCASAIVLQQPSGCHLESKTSDSFYSNVKLKV